MKRNRGAFIVSFFLLLCWSFLMFFLIFSNVCFREESIRVVVIISESLCLIFCFCLAIFKFVYPTMKVGFFVPLVMLNIFNVVLVTTLNMCANKFLGNRFIIIQAMLFLVSLIIEIPMYAYSVKKEN